MLFFSTERRLENVDYFLAHDAAIKASLAAITERNDAFLHCKESVILSDLNILTSLNLSTALADDDHTRTSLLTSRELNAEIFRIGVVEVFGGAAGFSGCHSGMLLRV